MSTSTSSCAREKTDKIFVDPRRVRQRAAPELPGPGHRPATPRARRRSTARCTTRSPSRTARWTTRTVWQPDYNQQHYQDLYFGTGTGAESLKTYYEKQSSGRYTVDGEVTDWVKVPLQRGPLRPQQRLPVRQQRLHQHLGPDPATRINRVGRRPAGRRAAPTPQIKADLASYDQWDRYDYDGDGNFNEPDGYIDHFQIVHAGGDQADGDPQQGEDAIWSHRWYAFQNTGRRPGRQQARRHPDRQHRPLGRRLHDPARERRPRRLRARVRPRPRPAGPLRHLGAGGGQRRQLVDADGAEPASAPPSDQGIGTRAGRPRRLGQAAARLARLRDRRGRPGQARCDLGPHEYNSNKAQGVVVVLPKKTGHDRSSAPPAAGTKQWWSGTGDDLDNTLTRSVTLPAGTATLTFQAQLGHRGLRPRRVRLRVRRGRRRHRLQGRSPARSPSRPRATASTATSAGWRAGDVRPVGLRGQDGRPAVPLPHRRRAPGGRRASSPTTITVTAGGDDACSPTAPRPAPTAGPRTASPPSARTLTTAYDNYYIASQPHVRRPTTSTCRPARTTSASPTPPDWVEHFPYQNGPAGHLLGHLAVGQQHQRSTRARA